jgi:hypothetical protein
VADTETPADEVAVLDVPDDAVTYELNRVFKRLGAIEDKLDELLADSRRARPLLDKYDKVAKLPWVGAPKGQRR